MNESVISWTAPNIITIALMMIIASAVMGAVAKVVMSRRASE